MAKLVSCPFFLISNQLELPSILLRKPTASAFALISQYTLGAVHSWGTSNASGWSFLANFLIELNPHLWPISFSCIKLVASFTQFQIILLDLMTCFTRDYGLYLSLEIIWRLFIILKSCSYLSFRPLLRMQEKNLLFKMVILLCRFTNFKFSTFRINSPKHSYTLKILVFL